MRSIDFVTVTQIQNLKKKLTLIVLFYGKYIMITDGRLDKVKARCRPTHPQTRKPQCLSTVEI